MDNIREPVSPSAHGRLVPSYLTTLSNPPAFFIDLINSPTVRWSGFSFRSRAIASTSSPCLSTSRLRYPISPSDMNLAAPRLPWSPEIFSSSRVARDANNQLGNCTKNFHLIRPIPFTTEFRRLIRVVVRGPNCVWVFTEFSST